MISSVDKALVALIMGVLFLLSHFAGINLGLGEDTITGIVGVLTPLLVYLVPNKKPT